MSAHSKSLIMKHRITHIVAAARRIMRLSASAALVAMALAACSGPADVDIDGITYSIYSDSTATAVGVPADKPVAKDGHLAIRQIVNTGKLTCTVTEISDEAFKDCKWLKSVTIPSTVAKIGKGAFNGCSGLTEIHCQVVAPLEVDSTVFVGINADACRLFVPMSSGTSYASAPVWAQFNISEEGCIVK